MSLWRSEGEQQSVWEPEAGRVGGLPAERMGVWRQEPWGELHRDLASSFPLGSHYSRGSRRAGGLKRTSPEHSLAATL